MSQRIDELCEDLRVKLTNIDDNISGLKSKIDTNAQRAEQDVRSQLDNLHRQVEQSRAKVTAERAEVKKWLDDQKVATGEKIAEWKHNRETSKLRHRADDAERYAVAAKDIAAAALDEAALAALEAWVARQDANVAQAK
jgi:hypothetical protein